VGGRTGKTAAIRATCPAGNVCSVLRQKFCTIARPVWAVAAPG